MPGHQLVDAVLWPSVDQARQQVSEVELRIDAIQLAGLCRPPNYAERTGFPQSGCDLDMIGSA